ncbi:MAG: MBL fold metallo-hydrolase [Caldilineaceae bacterium]
MKITFHGAAQEVTGSMHLVEVNGRKILLDCGLFQGKRSETYARNLNFPFDPKTIDAMILSHAHIDHAGNIPNLCKQGFTGSVICTAATRSLSSYMLLDSGHIQEQDIEYVNKQNIRRNEPLVEPIYTQADAQRALEQFIGVGLHRPIPVTDGVEVTFFEAGHIIGAAWIMLTIRESATNKNWRLIFSGDVGRQASPILNPPERPDTADIVIMESTYGNRLHDSYANAGKHLRDVINATARRRGKVIIPAFAVGRTQELVFALNQLDDEGDIPQLPIYIDSPLAVNATSVFRLHPETWNATVRSFMDNNKKRSPFDDINIDYIRDVRESKQLNHLHEPAIIISASGMAESGRILHHLKNNIEDSDNTILIVSFQAENTLGRKLKDGVDPVRIFGQEYHVRAHVESIEGYSAHADQAELLQWSGGLERKQLRQLFLVHGEPEAQTVLAGKLAENGFEHVLAPARGQSFEF